MTTQHLSTSRCMVECVNYQFLRLSYAAELLQASPADITNNTTLTPNELRYFRNDYIRPDWQMFLLLLLYGADTWTLLADDICRLQSFSMGCQHQILGVRWQDQVENVDTADTTGLPNITDIVDKKRHALFRHVVRLDTSVPAHQTLKQVIAMKAGRCSDINWWRPGCPRKTRIQQIGVGTTTSWRQPSVRYDDDDYHSYMLVLVRWSLTDWQNVTLGGVELQTGACSSTLPVSRSICQSISWQSHQHQHFYELCGGVLKSVESEKYSIQDQVCLYIYFYLYTAGCNSTNRPLNSSHITFVLVNKDNATVINDHAMSRAQFSVFKYALGRTKPTVTWWRNNDTNKEW